jgi:Icc-related predicted phosphoesterase
LISDTHELHRSVEMPPCDLLIHAGDWTFFSKSRRQIHDFNDWLGEQYAPLGRILSPGNHETYLEHDRHLSSLTSNGTVLIEERLAIRGLKLWASPITPHSAGGFTVRSPEERARRYAQIPLETDILITHGAPYGILDCAPGDSQHQGCRELLNAIKRIKPKIHVFGHVHQGYGVYQTPDTLFVNAALLGPDGDIDGPPIVVSIDEL